MLYLVSYNCSMPTDVKSRIESVLKTMPGWWHHLETTWIVASQLNLQQVTDMIHQAAATGDKILVVDITADSYNGWLPSKAWDWLRNENERERNQAQPPG